MLVDPFINWTPMRHVCRWPLFHGTSMSAAETIMAENRLRLAPFGWQVVSLSRNIRVAYSFAGGFIDGEREDGCGGAIFVLCRERLAQHYSIMPLRDGVWDSGGSWSKSAAGEPTNRHECEEVVFRDIHPLRAVSVGVFLYERKRWMWEPWREIETERQLHLFGRLAA